MEEKFEITPKGILWLTFNDFNIKMSDPLFNAIWDTFVERMDEHGYI